VFVARGLVVAEGLDVVLVVGRDEPALAGGLDVDVEAFAVGRDVEVEVEVESAVAFGLTGLLGAASGGILARFKNRRYG
jgi:hypothetical protein